VFVTVNSTAFREDCLFAPLVCWLLGDGESLGDCAFTLGLSFAHTGILGMPPSDVRLLIGCEDIEIRAGGLPLSVETWREQFAAWWRGWHEHWRKKADGEGPSAGQLEDTFIPAGEPDPPAPHYRPPPEPPVAWEPTDIPAEILWALTELFEARFAGDWQRLARVYPNLDLTTEERASQLAGWAVHDFGRWGYARQVDSWWSEGRHAEVVVRGVEHTMPEAGAAGQNVETVWTFRLRNATAGWVIRTWQQGWPPYGSAPARPAVEKPWLGRWRSGTVLCERREHSG
jgi:hypothetical protein